MINYCDFNPKKMKWLRVLSFLLGMKVSFFLNDKVRWYHYIISPLQVLLKYFIRKNFNSNYFYFFSFLIFFYTHSLFLF